MKQIKEYNFSGKRALVRLDFNVPLNDNFEVTDTTRIDAAVPTILKIVNDGGAAILMSHLGRPKGEKNGKYSLKHIVNVLSQKLGKEIKFVSDCIGEEVQQAAATLDAGEILLLENLRFHKAETEGDAGFAKKLADLADIYVNDAFGTAHRAHASTAGIAAYLPAVAGFLIQKELEVMGKALSKPKRPFVAILGGAKVSDKIGVIENLIDKVDTLIIGGGMAYTFLKAKGYGIGDSICEDDKIELAKSLMKKAEKKGVNLMLPVESIVSKEFKNDTEFKCVPSN